MDQKKRNQSSELMVSVRCATYNHAPYIRQCLDGFVMQQTTFRFEVIVHDDASTDGTTEIVREYAEKYPDIIKPMYEETNQYSVNLKDMNRRINERLTGKYIAICEGDDYWTDPLKLQRQMFFLEEHSDYSMCYHAVNYIQDGIVIKNDCLSLKECDVTLEQVVRGGGYFISTNSLFFRRELYSIYPKFRQMSDAGDYPLQIHLALNGKVHYFPSIMGCYRVGTIGSWSEKSENKEKHLVRYHNLIVWMKQLDEDTNGIYKSLIYSNISSFMFKPLRSGDCSFAEFNMYLNEVNPLCLSIRWTYRHLKFRMYLRSRLYRVLYDKIYKL